MEACRKCNRNLDAPWWLPLGLPRCFPRKGGVVSSSTAYPLVWVALEVAGGIPSKASRMQASACNWARVAFTKGAICPCGCCGCVCFGPPKTFWFPFKPQKQVPSKMDKPICYPFSDTRVAHCKGHPVHFIWTEQGATSARHILAAYTLTPGNAETVSFLRFSMKANPQRVS